MLLLIIIKYPFKELKRTVLKTYVQFILQCYITYNIKYDVAGTRNHRVY